MAELSFDLEEFFNLNTAGPQQPVYDDDGGITLGEACCKLSNDIMAAGLDPVNVVADGSIHRFGEKLNSWYWIEYDQASRAAFGSFGDWALMDPVPWSTHKVTDLDPGKVEAFNRRRVERQKEMEQQREKDQIEVSEAAKLEFKSLGHASPNHDYLVKKQVGTHHTRINGAGQLVIPLVDEKNTIWSLQYIAPDGSKRYKKGGKKDGCYFPIYGQTETVYITEGFSTGATVAQLTGAMTYCSFDAGNLPKVAIKVKEMHPDSRIVIAADNDHHLGEEKNKGLIKGKEAAHKVGGSIVYPEAIEGVSDFNDLYIVAGRDEAIGRLTMTSAVGKLPPLTMERTNLSGKLFERPPDPDFIFNVFDGGLLESNTVGALAATGGTGKTFLAIKLGLTLAEGEELGPISAPKKRRVLIVCYEDDELTIMRRLYNYTGGIVPNGFHVASVRGKVGALMKLDEARNPVYTDDYHWLEATIRNHNIPTDDFPEGLSLVILDPKSRLYGLDENNNDHATQWIRCLEKMSEQYKTSIIFTTHTSKDRAGNANQFANRGASAIVDGCRWVASLNRVTEEDSEKFGIDEDDADNYVQFSVTKTNNGKMLKHPLLFERGESGSLKYYDPSGDEGYSDMAKCMHRLLKNDPTIYSERDLTKSKECDHIIDDLVANFGNFSRRRIIPILAKYLLRNGHAIEVDLATKTKTRRGLKMV